jgi:hypothetical protein
MNGYLVMLVHMMDDLPIALFKSPNDAGDYAREVQEMPTDKIIKIFNTDCRTPICVKIVQFSDGFPVDVTIIKDFDATKQVTRKLL